MKNKLIQLVKQIESAGLLYQKELSNEENAIFLTFDGRTTVSVSVENGKWAYHVETELLRTIKYLINQLDNPKS